MPDTSLRDDAPEAAISDDTAPRSGFARAQLVLLVIGFFAGTACDQIHVRFGVLWYPHPFFLGQAIWVPFLFAGAAIAMGNGYALIASLLGGDSYRPGRATVVAPLAIFVAAYFSTGLLDAAAPRALTVGLVAAWLAHVATLRSKRQVIAYSIVCAVSGPLFEAALSSTGAFFYTRPAWLVPMWLPALYLHCGPLARHVQRAFLQPTPAPRNGLTFVYQPTRKP